MADLLPGGTEVQTGDEEPRVLGLDSEDADEVLSALSAATARSLLAAVHEEAATPSELADRVETSLQNAQYHIEKLESAGLIEECGTRYSSKGREMSVYGPTDRPLVLFAGDADAGSDVRSALRTLLGGVGVLAAASVLVQGLLVGWPGLPDGVAGGGDGGAGATTVQAFDVATDGGQSASAAASGLPPGLLFFLGGLTLVCLAVLWTFLRG